MLNWDYFILLQFWTSFILIGYQDLALVDQVGVEWLSGSFFVFWFTFIKIESSDLTGTMLFWYQILKIIRIAKKWCQKVYQDPEQLFIYIIIYIILYLYKCVEKLIKAFFLKKMFEVNWLLLKSIYDQYFLYSLRRIIGLLVC